MQRVTVLKLDFRQRGGLEKYTLQIIDAFLQAGCQVTLLTSGSCPEVSPEVEVVSLQIPGFPGYFGFSRLMTWDLLCKSYLAAHPADVVLGMDRTTCQTHIRAGNGVHAAYLQHRQHTDGLWKSLTFPLNPLHRALLRLEKKGFESPDLRLLITNSQMVQKEVEQFYNVPSEKISVIHNGVEWREMDEVFQRWPVEREELAKELGLDPQQFYFLFLGHHYRRKGLDHLLAGFAQLREKQAHLLVAGKESHLDDYRSTTRSLQIEERVHFLGLRKDAKRLYTLADAVVIPSLYDPFANVTVEALAMGVPVVSSRYNGGSEVLSKENGVIIDDLFDAESVANALTTAITLRKTKTNAPIVRNTVRHLDFSIQLDLLTKVCLGV